MDKNMEKVTMAALFHKIRAVAGKYFWSAAFWLNLVAISVFYVYAAAHLSTQNGDNIEHIHSSFLIAQGMVPYQDFFQHHNPLMWYLFAPLVNLFAYNSTITEVVCVLSVLFFLKSLIYVYRIVEMFSGGRIWGLAAAVGVAAPSYKLYAIDFRPDNYMIFCLMGGIYYYFLYLQEPRRKCLIAAFAWFFFAFMFAQKAVFPLAVIGGSVLYYLYRQQIKMTDFFVALIVPMVGFGLFGGYLIYHKMAELYWVSNYTFNLELANGFQDTKITEMPRYMAVWTVVGIVSAITAVFVKNKYWRIIALLLVAEVYQRRFYFSPYSYYYWLMLYLAVINGCFLLSRIRSLSKLLLAAVIVGAYYMLATSFVFQQMLIENDKNRPYLPDYVTRRISPCDYVFNGDGLMYNLFGKDPSYYWQLIGQLDVIGEKLGIAPKPNINEMIIKLRPKFIYGRSYFDKFSSEQGRLKIVHYVNSKLVDEMYEPTPFGAIYQLKEDYNKRECVKTPKGWVFKQ